MIRPRAGFSAPSQSALRYLRQLVFPRSTDHGISNQCSRVHARRKVVPERPYSSAATADITPEAAAKNLEQATPSGSPPHAGVPDRPEDSRLTEAARQQSLRCRLSVKESGKWYRQCLSWVDDGELEKLREAFNGAREERIHESLVQKVGVELMMRYNKLRKSHEPPSILYQLSLYPDFVSTRSLNLCLESYLARKYYTKFLETFKHYTSMRIVAPDHKTYELFIRCLVKIGNISEARQVLRLLNKQQKPITPTALAVFLGGLREKNASFEELQQEFALIRAQRPKLSPAIYNIMIEEALAYGKTLRAKEYVDIMIREGVKPNENTFAIFLRVQAHGSDWNGVRNALRQVEQKGMTLSAKTLNSLLDMFPDTHRLEETEEFFEALSQEIHFPDRGSYNIMIRACLQAINEPALQKWIKRMRRDGNEPDAVTFNTLFHDLRCSNVPRSLMYRVYNTVFNMDRNMVDEISRDIKRKAVNPIAKSIEYPVYEYEITHETDIAKRQTIAKMDSAIRQGRVRDCLNAFRESSAYIILSPDVMKHLARAYVAVSDEAIDIPAVLPRTHHRYLKIKDAVLTYMIGSVQDEIAKVPVAYPVILQLIHGVYKFMEANDIAISHNVSYRAAATLINRQDAVGALHIINEVSKTRWGRKTEWDISGLTVLLRAYSVMNDMRGLRWVITRVLASREVPDEKFYEYLGRAAKTAASKADRREIESLTQQTREHKEFMWTDVNRRAGDVVDVFRRARKS